MVGQLVALGGDRRQANCAEPPHCYQKPAEWVRKTRPVGLKWPVELEICWNAYDEEYDISEV